jgi:omega-hydroxypalmitate O-feruloyl transferase
MGRIELVEKVVIAPEQPTPSKKMFLSNIDLSLVVYQDSASFFDPPTNQMCFSEICSKLYNALVKMLVHYGFMAGRLVPSLEEKNRFEIDCNDAGIVVAAARTDRKLCEFGVISAPNPELKELVVFLLKDGDEEIDLKEIPLASLQVIFYSFFIFWLITDLVPLFCSAHENGPPIFKMWHTILELFERD